MGCRQRQIKQHIHHFMWVSLCVLLGPVGISHSDSLYPGIVDCNSNGIPDSDDIDLFLVSDCNENGIPDDCDIAQGIALDLDDDGFPDDCICLDRQFITSPNEFEGEFFGLSVDVSDGWAVVGSEAGSPARMYQFLSGQWQLHSELLPGIPVGSQYTHVVSIDQGVIAISDLINSHAAVHVFRYDIITLAWQYETTLIDDLNEFSGVRSPKGVVMYQNVIAVGMHTLNFEGSSPIIRGKVQIYRYDTVAATWNMEAQIDAPAGVSAGDFATSIDIDSNVLGVVASHSNVSMFRYDNLSKSWSFEAFLEPEVTSFSSFVALSGNVVVVGDQDSEPVDQPLRESLGQARVYRFDGASWLLEAILYPTNSMARRRILLFGQTVAIDQNCISISTNWTDNTVTGGSLAFGGAIHIFRHDGTNWIADGAVFQYPDGLAFSSLTTDENFGRSIAMDGNHVIVGSPRKVNLGIESGAVYIFSGIRNPDQNANGLPDTCEGIIIGDFDGDGLVNVTDLLMLLSSWGTCVACPADINGDNMINVTDLLILLGHWG